MTRRATATLTTALALLLLVSGCGGSGSSADGKPVGDVLAAAKKKFDESSSVHLVLSTKSRPSGGDAVLGADGTLTHQPAFEGKVTVVLGGLDAAVPVISVDGKVYAKLLSIKYVTIDPSEYGAPDPSDFADPAAGVSGLLLKLDGAKETGRKRNGDQVLTTYTGTLSGDLVEPIIPSADSGSDYRTVVGIDEQGRIATLSVTGKFFSGPDQVTYTLAFDEYGKNVTVKAP